MEWINVILQGVLVGGLYAMFAAGLSLIFGVMRLVNIAHGDLIVLAAYIALVTTETLGIGPLTEPAQVHRHAVGTAHQRGERLGAQRSVWVAIGSGPVQVRHQAGVRSARRRGRPLVGIGRHGGRQAADCAAERGRDRRVDEVQRLDGRVDGPGPGSQVHPASVLPLLGRGVVPVVAGEIEFGQVVQRIAAVQFELAECDAGALLERRQVRLVVRIGQRLVRGRGRGEPG